MATPPSAAVIEDPPVRAALAQPLYATPRDPSLSSAGARVAVVAEALGTPLMPWQRRVADVATERLPDGRYRYPVVVVTVPRQSGKTTLMRAVGVERAIAYPDAPVFYTAQTGKDARERWRDLVKQLRASPFRSQITVREAAGSERVIFPNGSEFRCFAPVGAGLHGYTPPTVMLDEVWAHDDAKGEELMGAIVPAQITLPHRQLWLVSTAGTSASGFLRKWVDAGRAGADGVALFEWAAPDSADPYDPATLREFHPAVGWVRPDGTPQVTVEDLLDAAERNSRAEYERAYLNRWTVTESVLIPADVWRDLGDQAVDPVDPARVVLTYDVAHDRRSASILGTWRDGDVVRTRVVLADTGTSWVAPALEELCRNVAPAAVGADDGGPARQVTDALHRSGVLRDLGIRHEVLGAREFCMATGSYLSAIDDGTIRHDASELLADSIAGVVTRPMADGVAFSRRHSAGDSSPAIASTVGAWLVDHLGPDQGAPVIRFAS